MTQVYSEIGRLRKVMLHRPGRELCQVLPSQLSGMLFEDTPYLAEAQKEHDAFAKILTDAGVEVLYLTDLMKSAFESPKVRYEFVSEFLEASHITSPALVEKLEDLYLRMSPDELVETVLCGIRSDDARLQDVTSFGNLGAREAVFAVCPLPNIYFMRDNSISLGHDVIYSHMEKRVRKREAIVLRYVRQHAKEFQDTKEEDLYDLSFPQRIEGGDVLVLSDHSVIIGCSERTSPVAIEYIAHSLFERGYTEVYAFDIGMHRSSMHLDISLSMVDVDTFLYNPLIDGTTDIYRLFPAPTGVGYDYVGKDWHRALAQATGNPDVRLIPCGGDDPVDTEWELWNLGANVLAIAPGEVVGYERTPITLDLLDKAGIAVHTFPSGELSRGRGGTHCMSMPLVRDLL